MNNSIRLHPKYGVNPTIPICQWCGKERNEVALLGYAYKGEAPKHMVIDDVPCDECKAGMAQGITLIEATGSQSEPKLTGRWLVIKEEAAARIFHPAELVAQVLKVRKAFVEPEVFDAFLAGAKESV